MKDAFGVEISKKDNVKRNTVMGVAAGAAGGAALHTGASAVGSSLAGGMLGAGNRRAEKQATARIFRATTRPSKFIVPVAVGAGATGLVTYAVSAHNRHKREVKKLHEVNKAWNSILKPNMGVGPTMTPKQMKQARKAAQQVNAIKPKKAQKIMNAAAAEPQGTQVAPGVTAYAPQPPKAPKPAKQKKQKSFFERNRTGLMWGGGGAGAGLLGGYAMSGGNRG